MWAVFDNNKPANHTYFHHAQKEEFITNEFNSFDEALTYARKWLGHWDNFPEDIEPNFNLKIDISGHGDIIEVRDLNKISSIKENDLNKDLKFSKEELLEQTQLKAKRLTELLPERQYMRAGSEKIIERKLLIYEEEIPNGVYTSLIEGKTYRLVVGDKQSLTRIT